ncbi:DUF2382 domain-containing protein [Anabaena aphanizomenioides LEGE 00250]|uniref:DUF2382 domain-containing protein n=1 Tax=Sphaerospermopsis aphanizomenoides LEGE 00250 TaxID=2777972 RepID=A0ABR9VJQ4_9CYAN|nr:DUF2382 domain-containing protein [Sphaerospermopsis aphanizomenoides]MBE9238733.1 DUF2382 domain-containing protein [Sphaerospermopsis aphanizomenoides LEGE 00250]
MPLYKLEEFDPNYRETFGGDDIKTLNLYTEGGTEVGAVADALVDENGRFRYLVIDTSLDTVGKKILLPIGLARINYPAGRVYVDGLSKQQVEHLPEYRENIIVDQSFEELVRSIYRSHLGTITYELETYNYEQEPTLYGLNEQYHQTLRLYEERLIANKHRVKTGEVAVGKHIETETARVTVPIEKERVVIDRVQTPEIGTIVDPNEIKFQAGEVAHIDVYQETPEIHKEAFVREEVRVRKVVDRDIVEAEDTIRREELDVNTSGELNINENRA